MLLTAPGSGLANGSRTTASIPYMPGVQRRAFADAITVRTGDEIIIPRIRMALANRAMQSFKVTMPRMGPREPDGWFHPSTHPLWTERQLVYYLRAFDAVTSMPGGSVPVVPVALETEEMDYISIYTIYQGHWLHGFTQHILFDAGLLVDINPRGKDAADHVEYPVVDPILRSRGHMDGMLRSDALGLSEPVGLELKSMNGFKLSKCPKGPASDPARLKWLLSEKPGYFLQAQEYMRINGHRQQRMVFISPSYPFDMVEIAVPYDEATALSIATKYAAVREHHRDGTLPDPCCPVGSPLSKSCVARHICPIGRMSA